MSISSRVLADLEQFIQAVWSPTSSFGSLRNSSNLDEGASPSVDQPDLSPSPDELNEILSSYVDRYREKLSVYKPRVSAVIGQPDFQSVSFLPLSLERSNAVCRIARYCCPSTLHGVFNSLRQRAKTIAENFPAFDSKSSFNPLEELKSSFLIPTSLFNEMFPENVRQAKLTYLEAIDALEAHIDELLKLNPLPLGTGFLVGGSHLLTNHHVIPSLQVAEQCVAQFSYEDKPDRSSSLDYSFNPKLFFVCNPELDYTLVQLKPNPSTRRPAGYRFGWIDLIDSKDTVVPKLEKDQVKQLVERLKKYGYTSEQLEDYGLTEAEEELPGDRVAIIQHPRGRKKEIVLQNNGIDKLSKNNINYKADTDYGSSGSPVFDMNWKLVALTKRVVPRLKQLSDSSSIPEQGSNADQNPQLNAGNRGDQDASIELEWIDSQGTRICRIIEDLKQQSANHSKLRSFIEDFVITSEQLTYPPFAAALNFDGVCDYLQSPTSNNVHSDKNLTESFSFEAWLNPQYLKKDLTLFTKFCKEAWATEDSNLGDCVLSLQINTTGQVVISRSMALASHLKASLLYPKHCLALFYPKVYPDAELKLGDRAGKVKLFKQFFNIVLSSLSDLNTIISELADDDNFDGATKKAIEAFQSSRGLTRDGIVGPKTLNALWNPFRKEDQDQVFFKKGDQGFGVKLLQTILTFDQTILMVDQTVKSPNSTKTATELLDHLRKADGTFDDKTEEAVRRYQKSRGIVVDGVINPATLQNLWTFGLSLRPGQNGVITPGSQGQSVVDLQNILQRLGLDCLSNTDLSNTDVCSSVFDDKTTQAVKEFQQKHNLAADGIVGSSTLRALKEARSYKLRTKDSLSFTEFHCIALTYGSEEIKLYFNGKPVEVELLKQDDNQASPKIEALTDCGMPLLVGAYSDEIDTIDQVVSNRSNYFKGAMSELRVWNIERRAPEIKQDLYRRLNGNEKNLVRYWRCEPGRDKLVYADSPSKDPELQWLRANQYPSTALPSGLRFRGEKKPNVICDSTADLNTAGALTIEAWIKPKFGNCWIVSRSNGSNEDGWGYCLGWHDGKIRVMLQGKNSKTIVDTRDSLQDQMWHHVAFTWGLNPKDQEQSEINVYIDGGLQDTIVLEGHCKTVISSGKIQTVGLFAESFDQLNANLVIGYRKNDQRYYDMSISDVRIWNIARTQNQIKTNMSQRLSMQGSNWSNLLGYWRLDDGGQDNKQARNLVRDGNHGTIHDAEWFPLSPMLPKDESIREISTLLSSSHLT